MTEKSLVFLCTSAEDGATKQVNEEYVRSALSGHYRDIDLAIKCIVDGIQIRIPFELFAIKHGSN